MALWIRPCGLQLCCCPNLHFPSQAQPSHTCGLRIGTSSHALWPQWCRLSLWSDRAVVQSLGKPLSGARKRVKPEASVCKSAEASVKRTKWCRKRLAARVCIGLWKCHPSGHIQGFRRSLNTLHPPHSTRLQHTTPTSHLRWSPTGNEHPRQTSVSDALRNKQNSFSSPSAFLIQ